MQTRFRLQGPLLTFRDVRRELNAKYGLSMSVGTVHRLAHGHLPASVDLRRALGLPFELPTPACAKCGVVHSRQCRQVPGWVSAAADWLAKRQKESAK